jgi:hypothetical protein
MENQTTMTAFRLSCVIKIYIFYSVGIASKIPNYGPETQHPLGKLSFMICVLTILVLFFPVL